MFSTTYGRTVLTRTALIGKDNISAMKGYFSSTSITEVPSFESSIATHSCPLSVPDTGGSMFSYFLIPTVDPQNPGVGGGVGVVPLRVFSMVVVGSSSEQVRPAA